MNSQVCLNFKVNWGQSRANNLVIFSELNGSQFYGLDSLRHLRLSFNKISRINRNAFAGVYRLETLYLDKNKITNIHPITFRGLASLKLLSLEGNSIKSIHPTTFITLVLGNLIPFSSLQIIKLNNNFLEVRNPRWTTLYHGRPW